MKGTLSAIKADVGSIGSHTSPCVSIRTRSSMSLFDGPRIASGLAFCVRNGKLTEPVDWFDHPYWCWIRTKVSEKDRCIRKQGFSRSAMMPYSNLEAGGIKIRLDALQSKFAVRNPEG